MDVYLDNFLIGKKQLQSNNLMKINLSSKLLTITASNSLYRKLMSSTLQSREYFRAAFRAAFIHFDNVPRMRYKVQNILQHSSVYNYLNEFRNVVPTILDMNDGEMLDKFCATLKSKVRLEVLKYGTSNGYDDANIWLNVNTALFGAGMFSGEIPIFCPTSPEY